MRPIDVGLGVHRGLPADEYHALPGVSASMLRKFWRTTPAHAKVALEEPFVETAVMRMGTLVHSLVLEPEEPLPGIAIQPETYISAKGEEKPWHNGATACKDWHVTMIESGLMPLTHDEYSAVYGMARSIALHPIAGPLFREGQSEISLVAWNMANKIETRCRIDWVPTASVLVDIKTCRDASVRGFERISYEMGYHIQAAWYLDHWNSLCGADDRKDGMVFVVVENYAPFAVNVFNCTAELLNAGRRDYAELLATYVRCEERQEWPGYPTIQQDLRLPKWAGVE